MVPVVKDIGDGPKAPGSHSAGACVTTVHGPKHEVALVWIQLQQQHHCLTTQLVNLEDDHTETVAHQYLLLLSLYRQNMDLSFFAITQNSDLI